LGLNASEVGRYVATIYGSPRSRKKPRPVIREHGGSRGGPHHPFPRAVSTSPQLVKSTPGGAEESLRNQDQLKDKYGDSAGDLHAEPIHVLFPSRHH